MPPSKPHSVAARQIEVAGTSGQRPCRPFCGLVFAIGRQRRYVGLVHIFVDEFSVTGHWEGIFDEPALCRWAESLRASLRAPQVSLGLVFMSPEWFADAEETLEVLRVHAQIPLLLGCSSAGLIVNRQEIEGVPGLVLGLYSLPGAELRTAHFTQEQVETAEQPAHWSHVTRVRPEDTSGWLVFADPFHLDGETWLAQWNEAFPGLPVLGGLASGRGSEQRTQIYLDGEVHEDGAVALSVGGAVELRGGVSQGATPIGQPWTITRVEGNLIQEIANRPAYQVLADTVKGLSDEEQKRAQGNLLVGFVTNEYQEEFQRGDFLIRNLLGGDPKSGVLAVGARPRPGQSLQFQCRDPEAATEDLLESFTRTRDAVDGRPLYGGCLCLCNGRGQRLFKRHNHDAELTQEVFGPLGVTGFFGSGEMGPIGGRNYLHGYTASLALFAKK